MKLQHKASLTIIVTGALFFVIVSVIYYYKNSNFAVTSAQVSSQVIVDQFAHTIEEQLKRDAQVAYTLVNAPLITKALVSSNSDFASLTKKSRDREITRLNEKWMDIKDIQSPFIQTYMDNPVASYLRKQQDMFPDFFGEIFLTNRYGVAIATTKKLTTLAHAPKYWWVGSYYGGEGRIFFDDRGYDESVKGYVLGITIPVKDGDEILGILKCNVKILESYSNIFNEFTKKEPGIMRLVRSKGRIVFEKGVEPLSNQISEPLIIEKMNSWSANSIITTIAGVRKIISYAPVAITKGSDQYGFGGSYKSIDHIKGNLGEGWFVIFSRDIQETIAASVSFTKGMLLVGFTLILCMAISALLFGKKIAGPIAHLANITKKVGKGDFNFEIEITSKDEVGALAMSFNKMITNLRETTISRDKLLEEINQRKQVEKSLMESEARYRSLIENQTDLVCRFTPDGTFVFVNDIYCKFFSMSKNELIGSKWQPLAVNDIDLINEKLSLLSLKDPTFSFDTRVRSGNGKIHWIHIVNSGIFGSQGKLLEIQSVGRDITERRQTEVLLRQSKQLLEDTQLIAQVGGWELDLATNNLFWTAETYRIYDTSPTEFTPTVDAGVDYFLPESRRIISEALEVAMEKGEGYDLVLETLTTKGRRIDVRNTCKVIYLEGRPTKLAGIIQDITERKQAEAEKKRLEIQLQHALRMDSIGTLAGGIAHEFNNVLSSVIGFTELALDAVEKETPIADDLQEVYTAGLRAKDLVNQILTFARQSDEKLKPIQVDYIIKEVLKLIRSSIASRVEIKQNISSASCIMGNVSQIHQIMMNLCTNAAHAMEDNGGILEITLKDTTIDKTNHRMKQHLEFGNYIIIKVSDTGVGIESHNIEKIYEPYFTTKGQGEGTGMGLAMVHGIVETYGGKIFVESKLDTGTIFTIYLPVTRESKAHQQYKVEELPTGQERILFVDDEVQLAKMASKILGQLGYSVTTKTNSADALELFRSKPHDFDLVISDVTMPTMTGDQLTQKLLQIRPDIPVILCTGYSKRLSEEKAFEIGIKTFLHKPIIKEDLAKIVRKVLDESENMTST